MNHPLLIQIPKNSATLIVYHPDRHAPRVPKLADALGQTVKDERGAYVYPLSPLKRHAFKMLRHWFGGAGRVAAWTRKWPGPWVVQLPGAYLRLPGAYRTHTAAVMAEVQWLLTKERRNVTTL